MQRSDKIRGQDFAISRELSAPALEVNAANKAQIIISNSGPSFEINLPTGKRHVPRTLLTSWRWRWAWPRPAPAKNEIGPNWQWM